MVAFLLGGCLEFAARHGAFTHLSGCDRATGVERRRITSTSDQFTHSTSLRPRCVRWRVVRWLLHGLRQAHRNGNRGRNAPGGLPHKATKTTKTTKATEL